MKPLHAKARKIKTWQKSLFAIGVILISPLAQAHDNSLSTGLLAGLSHPLLGVDHLVALVLAGLLLGRLTSGKQSALGGLLLALGLGAAGGAMLGAQMWIEAAILLSLPIFFALQWASTQLKTATMVMGIFMLAHGWAHGVEMANMNMAFIAGFLWTSAITMAASSLLGAALHSRIQARTSATRHV